MMTALDPAKLSVADITSGFAAGEFSAREMVDAAFEVIEQRDKDIHAFLELTPELSQKFAEAQVVTVTLQVGDFTSATIYLKGTPPVPEQA